MLWYFVRNTIISGLCYLFIRLLFTVLINWLIIERWKLQAAIVDERVKAGLVLAYEPEIPGLKKVSQSLHHMIPSATTGSPLMPLP